MRGWPLRRAPFPTRTSAAKGNRPTGAKAGNGWRLRERTKGGAMKFLERDGVRLA